MPHDSRLFSLQILFATASSPLSWTGGASGGFSIIAFSLGGGIVMSFIAHFHYLVNSIILLAPAGILRRMPDDYKNVFFRLSSVVPSTYLRILVGKLLGVNLSIPSSALNGGQVEDDTDPKIPKDSERVGADTLDIGGIVQWQFDHHKGFVHSFIDTTIYGPIMHQQSDWKRASDIIKGVVVTSPMSGRRSKLYNSKILVIFGDADGIVPEKEVSEDIGQLLGSPEHVEFKTVPGGHGFPVPSCDEVVKHIRSFWNI